MKDFPFVLSKKYQIYPKPPAEKPPQTGIIWLLFDVMNFYCHITQKNYGFVVQAQSNSPIIGKPKIGSKQY